MPLEQTEFFDSFCKAWVNFKRRFLIKTNLIARQLLMKTNLIARQLLMKINLLATVSHENQSYSYSFS